MSELSSYKEIWTFLIAMMPVVELRGALPYALYAGIHPALAIFLSVAGNLLPMPFILLFIRPIFTYLKKLEKLRAFIHRLEEKAFKKSEDVLKYNFIGLAIFVAIPLPGTGAWTGALIAALLDMRFKSAISSITLGVIGASGIVTGVFYLIKSGAAPFLQWVLG